MSGVPNSNQALIAKQTVALRRSVVDPTRAIINQQFGTPPVGYAPTSAPKSKPKPRPKAKRASK